MLILLALLACQDPELARYHDALAVWDEARAALDRGEHALAAERFARLAELDPHSAAAPAWRAVAQDRAGDTDGALATLDEALARFPDDPTLRYNRAALRARRGEVERAAEDLRILYAAGAVDPLEVGEDPDFAAVAADPSTASLAPPPDVKLALRGEDGPVLMGEDATLELVVEAKRGALVAITDMGEPSGSLRLRRLVEDIGLSEGRTTTRTLTATWRTLSPGDLRLGPWLVAAGGVSALSDRVALQILALPGRQVAGAPDEQGTLRSVEAALAGHEAPWAGREEGRVLVVLPAGARAEVVGPEGARDPDPALLELRREGQTVAQAELHRLSGACAARIERAGQVLLETQVPP